MVETDEMVVVELGVVIGEGGRDISEAQAEKHVAGYGPSPNSHRLCNKSNLVLIVLYLNSPGN